MSVGFRNKYSEGGSQIYDYNIHNNAVCAIILITMTLATRRVLANAKDVSLLLLAGQLPMSKYIFINSTVLLTGNGASVVVS